MMLGGHKQLSMTQLLFVVPHSKSNPTKGGTTVIKKTENLHRNIKNTDAPTLGTVKNTHTIFADEPWASFYVVHVLRGIKLRLLLMHNH